MTELEAGRGVWFISSNGNRWSNGWASFVLCEPWDRRSWIRPFGHEQVGQALSSTQCAQCSVSTLIPLVSWSLSLFLSLNCLPDPNLQFKTLKFIEALKKHFISHWLNIDDEVGKIDGHDDTFCITEKGVGALDITRSFHNKIDLVKFRLHESNHSNPNELVFFEAMLELHRLGWEQRVSTNVKKLDPYKIGGSKIWYFGGNPSVHYLRGLLQADSMFQKGLVSFFHAQPTSYYKTLITFLKDFPDRLNEVKPNQPHAFYKVLRQNAKKKRHQPGTDARPSSTADIDEDRGGWQWQWWCWATMFYRTNNLHLHPQTYVYLSILVKQPKPSNNCVFMLFNICIFCCILYFIIVYTMENWIVNCQSVQVLWSCRIV